MTVIEVHEVKEWMWLCSAAYCRMNTIAQVTVSLYKQITNVVKNTSPSQKIYYDCAWAVYATKPHVYAY